MSNFTVKKRKVDTDCRQFQEKWTDDYFFVVHNGLPICLLCNESVAVLKEYNLKRHFTSKHADKEKSEGPRRKDKIQNLKKNLSNQQQMFHKLRAQNDGFVKASFVVSEKIARCSKPFGEGEFIKECLQDVVDIICPEKRKEIDQISLSRPTVVRRIEMMSDDVKATLTDRIKQFQSFSIALDESTDLSDTAQLAIFICGVDINFNVTEELLALQALKGTTTGEDIFEAVKTEFLRFGLQWRQLSGICTNGAPAMVGERKGLIGIVKGKAEELNVQIDSLTIFHCIIHQQNLCAKSIKFANVMQVVITSINLIKSRALNHRQFKEYLEDLFSDYEDVSYYCEVRWLSRGKMLKRFYELRENIAEFMEVKGKTIPEMKDEKWVCDLAFLVDVTGHLNELNIKLQKQDQLVHELVGHVKAFRNKLRLWESQMRRNNSFHFPTLGAHRNIQHDAYADELKSLMEQFNVRFSDFQRKDSTFAMFSNPMNIDVDQAPIELQMELIELQEDLTLKRQSGESSLMEFYKTHLTEEKYKNLRAFARMMISLFGSTYKCEQFFSRMKFNKSNTRSRMTDENLENSLRLCVSNIRPNIEKVVTEVKSQLSH